MLTRGTEDLPEMLVESKRDGGPIPTTFHEAVAEAKKKLILDAVANASGSITEAGKFLGLHPNYLHRLISNLGLRDQIKIASGLQSIFVAQIARSFRGLLRRDDDDISRYFEESRQ